MHCGVSRYFESQIAIGEAVQGWTFWTWKVRVARYMTPTAYADAMVRRRQAENADDWSYQKGVEGGWIPKDPTDRLYPDICSNSSNS